MTIIKIAGLKLKIYIFDSKQHVFQIYVLLYLMLSLRFQVLVGVNIYS